MFGTILLRQLGPQTPLPAAWPEHLYVEYVFLNAATTPSREEDRTVDNVSFVQYRGEGNTSVENVFFYELGRLPTYGTCWQLGVGR